MKEKLFSYGTLQKDKVQLELFGRLLNGSKDVLNGYRLSSIEIKDETFLSKGEQEYQLTAIPSNDDTDIIEGMMFEISKQELLIVDDYEPDNYKKIELPLQSGNEAWIYIAAVDSPLLRS